MQPITTDDVLDLMDAYLTSAALNTALELGLFWLLADQPMDTNAIAQALDLPLNRCQYWIQLLNSSGLIVNSSGGYVPSATAKSAIMTAFSQDTWAFLAGDARDRYPAIFNLAQYIHKPSSTWALQGLTPPDYFAQISQSPDRARRFTRMLYEIHIPLAEEVAKILELSGVERLMDLGGGSGVVSLALLQRYPQLTATVVDIANVCSAGGEIAAERQMADRITYLAMDYMQDELPSGFDRVILCDAGPLKAELFRKIRATLNPGGHLVIVDHFAPSRGVAPSAWLYWAFLASLANPTFTLQTVMEVQDQLKEADFEILSVKNLSGSEVRRWSTDWVILDAQMKGFSSKHSRHAGSGLDPKPAL